MTGIETIVLPDGTERRLGNRRPPAGLTRAWPTYGDTPDAPMIPRSQWPDLIARMGGCDKPDYRDLPYVHDQNGIGQCNCDDTAAVIESCRMSQGLPFVKLSAADLYDRINGGADNGSLLEDAMHELLTRGIGTAETAGLIWHRGMRTAPDAERARYKALAVFLCPTFDHCMSAVVAGFRISSGVTWCQNYTPGPDGWLPPGRRAVGGHAVFGYKPAVRGSGRPPEFGIWHQNSWGASWGLGGRCVFPESMYAEGAVGGWWAVRSVVDEGGVVPTP